MSANRAPGTTRRALLAAGGLLTAALAGCTRLSEFITDRVTGEVNVFNTLDQRVAGSLTLTDAEGQTLLDERLDLAPGSGNSEGDREPAAIYEDVLGASGTYQLDLTVEETETTPERTTSEQLRVDDPDEERIVVLIGREVGDELLTVAVIEDFADLEEEIEE
jgi:hypothetical protein